MPPGDGLCPMCASMMGMGWGMMVLFALFWVAVLALIGWVIYRLVSGRRASSSRATPETILEERYARGEVDRETYQRMRTDLRSGEE